MAVKKSAAKPMTYAEMEARVQAIIQALSDDSLGLDQQVALGEEGQALLNQMDAKLTELKKKVSGISKTNDADNADPTAKD